ncbi:hemagglutinin repeat-containing protein [Pantoea agglomerans]|uniref:hemagglutinin repeat-containing protein n=1 Tax=Enterobacter agglomerans TaxID=549 RepID=UPI003DA08197
MHYSHVNRRNVAGTQDVALSAGRDLSITTAAETRDEVHQHEEKKSGLMGTGAIGFTVGQAMQKSSTDASGMLNRGSTVGSSDGSVTLSAGNQLTVHGSDVVGVVAPPVLKLILGPSSGFVSDIISSVGGEFIGNKVKDKINKKDSNDVEK